MTSLSSKRRRTPVTTSEPAPPDPDDELLKTLEDGRASAETIALVYRQFWSEFLPLMSAGEKNTRLKFSERYHGLDVRKKIRLLEVSGRDEVAADILSNSFSTLAPELQTEFLRVLPLHQVEVASHVLRQHFATMSEKQRARFLEVAPRRTLVELLESSPEMLTVSEVLTTALSLHDKQYTRLRLEVCELVWRERHRCTDGDLVTLARLALPPLGRDIVAEIVSRFESNARRHGVGGAQAPDKGTVPVRPSDDNTKTLNEEEEEEDEEEEEEEEEDETVALVFPKRMCECFEDLGVGRRVLTPTAHLPLLRDQHWRVHIRDVDWEVAATSFITIVLTRKIDDESELVVTVNTCEFSLPVVLGSIANASPTLRISFPSHLLGTASSFFLDAHQRVSLPLAQNEKTAVAAATAVCSSDNTVMGAPVLRTRSDEFVSASNCIVDRSLRVVVIFPALDELSSKMQFRDFIVEEGETFDSLKERACHSMGLSPLTNFVLRDASSRPCVPNRSVSERRQADASSLLFFIDRASPVE